MLYTEADYATLERNAWQRGDYAQAEAFALALAEKEAREEAERETQEVRESLPDFDALGQQVLDVMTTVENAERVSDRAAIMEALQGLLDDINKAGAA